MNKIHSDTYTPIPSDTKENQLCSMEPSILKQCFSMTLDALEKALEFINNEDLEAPDRIDYINYLTGYLVYYPNACIGISARG